MYNVINDSSLEQHILYLRKSQMDSDYETIEEVLERHEKQLMELIHERGYYVPSENIYKEVGSSETIDGRPEFLKVLKRLEKKDITSIIVIDPQRLSRGNLSEIGRLSSILEHTNTKVTCPNMTYDLTKPHEKKFFETELIRGNEYLEYVKVRLNSGKYSSCKAGMYIHSIPPFGYKRKKLKPKGFTLEFNEETETVKMIFNWCLNGLGPCAISNKLNTMRVESNNDTPWTEVKVRRILKNEVYIGIIVWQKKTTETFYVNEKLYKKIVLKDEYEKFKGLHDPIISTDIFNKVQTLLNKESSKNVPKEYELQNPFAGLIFCNKCGNALTRKIKNRTIKDTYKQVDKYALNHLLREHKNMPVKDIATKLNVSIYTIKTWFSTNADKFYVSETFRTNWLELKSLLNIETNEFDILLEKNTPKDKHMLVCKNQTCDNISSYIYLIEEEVLNELNNTLVEYKYYVDNYEQKLITEIRSNKKQLERIDSKIEKLKKAIKNARRDYNLELFTYDEYMEDRVTFENEIKHLEKEKETLSNSKEEEVIIQRKKSIPKIEECLKKYNTLNITDKNKMLKNIIEKVTYEKNEKGSRNKSSDNFELKITLKV